MAGRKKISRRKKPAGRLERQLEFIRQIDGLKKVKRQTLLMDSSRYENDAEHSWHIAVMAVILAGYAREKIDLARVLKMLLIHDVVEIDAGDTFCYSGVPKAEQHEKEARAAKRIFGLLPRQQAAEMQKLWLEFDRRRTPDSRFAAALDRLQPLFHNFNTMGAAWRKHGVTREKVVERNRHIADGAPVLWRFAQKIIETSVRRGYLKKETSPS